MPGRRSVTLAKLAFIEQGVHENLAPLAVNMSLDLVALAKKGVHLRKC